MLKEATSSALVTESDGVHRPVAEMATVKAAPQRAMTKALSSALDPEAESVNYARQPAVQISLSRVLCGRLGQQQPGRWIELDAAAIDAERLGGGEGAVEPEQRDGPARHTGADNAQLSRAGADAGACG